MNNSVPWLFYLASTPFGNPAFAQPRPACVPEFLDLPREFLDLTRQPAPFDDTARQVAQAAALRTRDQEPAARSRFWLFRRRPRD